MKLSTSSREWDCNGILFLSSERSIVSHWSGKGQLVMLSLLEFKTQCLIGFILVGNELKVNEKNDNFFLIISPLF